MDIIIFQRNDDKLVSDGGLSVTSKDLQAFYGVSDNNEGFVCDLFVFVDVDFETDSKIRVGFFN